MAILPPRGTARQWYHVLRLLLTILFLSLALSATIVSTGNSLSLPAGSLSAAQEPPAAPAPQTMTGDGRLVVLIFLKEQPFHEASRQARAEYEPRFEALYARIRAVAPTPWEGQSIATVQEEQEAVRQALDPRVHRESSAQQDQVRALRGQMDALNSEMRREMVNLARPHLEASQAELVQAIASLGGQVLHRYTVLNGLAAAIPPGARAALEARSDVAEVADDRLVSAYLNVSVPTTLADTWWTAGYDGGTLDTAIVDSGIDATHPGLSSQNFYESRCLDTADAAFPGMPGLDPTVDDANGHGTHVAGIVASTDSTYRGVAFGLDTIFNCKAAFDQDGSDGGTASMYWSDGIDCVDWAVASCTTCGGDLADVLNLSYGGSTSSDDSAFARFWDAVVDDVGVPAAIAAGNSGPSSYTVGDPSIAYNVLCVANMSDQNTTSRSDDVIRNTSSRGPTASGRRKPDITAPGTSILSANNTWESENDWVAYSGTSMASPHVAGASLLLADYYGFARPMVQKAILINTATDWGTSGWDSIYGWGYIDLDHAYFHRDDWFSESISPQPDFDLFEGTCASGDSVTLVWNRRVDYAGVSSPSTYYALSNLDLYLYDEANDRSIDSDTSAIDNTHLVRCDAAYGAVVLKVDALSSSFAGAAAEPYALATEEGFAPAGGPAFSLGTSSYARCVADEWTVGVTVSNTGDLAGHNVGASLSVPVGLSLTSGPNPRTLGTIAEDGSQIASWTLRADAAGDYSVPVSISSSSYGESFSAAGSFTVAVSAILAAPSLLSPAGGSSTCDTAPTFEWSPVVGATSYRIQVDGSSGFSSTEIDTTTATSEYTSTLALAPGTHYWRVAATNSCGNDNWSPAQSIVILSTPSTLSHLSPADGSSTCDPIPAFEWSPVAQTSSYRIQVDSDSGFASPAIDTITASSAYTPAAALPLDTYYWRVLATNACGSSPWSPAWSVEIASAPVPSTPSPIAPASGSTTCNTTPTFEWAPVSGATGYTIQVDDDPGFGSPTSDVSIASSVYTPTSALPPGTYYWRVSASNACGDSPWSPAWSTVVESTPSMPSLLSPANGGITHDTTPTFEWATVTGTVSYTLQVDDDAGFGSPVIAGSTISSDYALSSDLPFGIYYWRVTASNSCGDSAWSSAWTLMIARAVYLPAILRDFP